MYFVLAVKSQQGNKDPFVHYSYKTELFRRHYINNGHRGISKDMENLTQNLVLLLTVLKVNYLMKLTSVHLSHEHCLILFCLNKHF